MDGGGDGDDAVECGRGMEEDDGDPGDGDEADGIDGGAAQSMDEQMSNVNGGGALLSVDERVEGRRRRSRGGGKGGKRRKLAGHQRDDVGE